MSRAVKVEILGQEYLIRSEEDKEQVQKIAAYVSEKLEEMQGQTEGLSPRKTAILVALNIASDYFQLLGERQQIREGLQQRTEVLINHIDRAIE